MKSTLSIFVATILLLASNSAEAARGTAAANRNQGMAPIPQISTAAPQTNPIGGTNRMVQAQSGAPWTPTTLPPAKLNSGEAFYGDAPVLGETYDTGYEPIKDASGVIGAYYVGYPK